MRLDLDLKLLPLFRLIEMKQEIDEAIKEKLNESEMPLKYFTLNARTSRFLINNRIKTLEQLAGYTENEFRNLKNVSEYIINECSELLKANYLNWSSK